MRLQLHSTVIIFFMTAVLPVTRAASAEDPNEKLEICRSCHGETGISQMQGVPSLAGRAASELAGQLRLFRSGQRQNPQMVMAKRLTDEEIEELTVFFAKQSAPEK